MSVTPIELVVRGQEETAAYACPKCGAVVSPSFFMAEGHRLAAKEALEHCDHRCSCGKSISNDRWRCNECWAQEETERHARKFIHATKVNEEGYEGPVFWRAEYNDGGYFVNLEELQDYCEENFLPFPEFVWACRPVPLEVSVDEVLSNAFEAQFEGARDLLEIGAEKELEDLLRDWCSRQKIQSWEVDYTRALVLAPREMDWQRLNREEGV